MSQLRLHFVRFVQRMHRARTLKFRHAKTDSAKSRAGYRNEYKQFFRETYLNCVQLEPGAGQAYNKVRDFLQAE
jgi:hypothetical protein